ncbi:hypothetical protein QQX98_007998 [Neonectria punicea]|uniref:Uncharacterized protein n=1 Tax=Neonectria punicea TaxID=979145 RepID=A0ABR1GW99_9HYPO
MPDGSSPEQTVQAKLGNPVKAKGLQLKAQTLVRKFARERKLPLSPVLTEKDFDEMTSYWAWY